ncbi:Atypical chemokine receptor 3 C-X-C chemokine receptor type 7 [Channa argus]|uniref:Atypical chemokine receptor 3 C-X-C chemokine receptor type 7 n=1 Tax=Channa argus TaxID=215402 RepID=A0A6G1P7Z0_CHAAH|nr:Atypical chemokine receptor 3 C-X-C chemokine receptor type 7 [Channa argus]
MAQEEVDGVTAAACVILGLSFLIGAPGNLLMIWTILRHVKQRSHTVVLILHLAIADLLAVITLPLWIYALAKSKEFKGNSCKVLVYIIKVCMFSSIFFITLMSVERFLAICHPFGWMRWKTKSAMNKCLVVLWLLAFVLGLPFAVAPNSKQFNQCFFIEFHSVGTAIIFLCLDTLGGFIVPFVILIICYCRVAATLKKMSFNSKQKSMILVYAVVTAFTVCWLPYRIIHIIHFVCIYGQQSEKNTKCPVDSIVYVAGALCFISSSVNPVLYAFFARNVQGSLGESRLVRLFREIVTNSDKLRDLVVQQQSGQRAPNTQEDCVETS